MRTPDEIVDTEYCKSGVTLADLVRLAVHEAVEEAANVVNCQTHLVSLVREFAVSAEAEIRDHFKKAGY